MINLEVQLNNFAYEYDLLMQLGKGNSENYCIIRDNITAWLTNTHHRLIIEGESENTKLKINESNSLEIDHINNLISHCMGGDSNSFYPSCFSFSINPNIPNTGGQMYTPGRLLQFLKM
jgi:hypothetical protein